MSKDLFKNKIIWLASYPKSGNTWFRAFLTALINEDEVEINKIKTDGIFSSREIFESISDIDSCDLYQQEIQNMQPDIFNQLALEVDKTCIIKVHDAFTKNSEDKYIIPEAVSHCAIYFIRNPLDVVGSFANHNATTIDRTIKLMNNPVGQLAAQPNNMNINNQTAQLMLDWSGHVKSWTKQPSFPVYVLRYEDMLSNTFNVFKDVINKIGWQYSDEQIKDAIKASSFEVLSAQEKEKGFAEKNIKSNVFFRGGKMGNWNDELDQIQINKIKEQHKEVMEEFGYL